MGTRRTIGNERAAMAGLPRGLEIFEFQDEWEGKLLVSKEDGACRDGGKVVSARRSVQWKLLVAVALGGSD